MHERTTPNKLPKQGKATIQRNGRLQSMKANRSEVQTTLSVSAKRMAFSKSKNKTKQKENNKIARLLLAEFRNYIK